MRSVRSEREISSRFKRVRLAESVEINIPLRVSAGGAAPKTGHIALKK